MSAREPRQTPRVDRAEADRQANGLMAAERLRLEQQRQALARFRARWPFWVGLFVAVMLGISQCGVAL